MRDVEERCFGSYFWFSHNIIFFFFEDRFPSRQKREIELGGRGALVPPSVIPPAPEKSEKRVTNKDHSADRRCDDDDGAFPSSGNDIDDEEDCRIEIKTDIGNREYDTQLTLRSIHRIAPHSGALRGHRHRYVVVVVVVGPGVFAFGTTAPAALAADRRRRE